MPINISNVGVEDGARLFSVMPSNRKRSNGQTREALPWHEEELYSECGRALAQAARGGCGVSLAGDIQNPPG